MKSNQLQLCITLFYSVLSLATLNGQILNLEKYRSLGEDTVKNYAINFNGTVTANNRSAAIDNPVNLFGYNFSLSSIYMPNRHGYIFIAHRNFLRINDNPFINFGYLHARVNFFRRERLSYELFAQMSDDNFRGLAPRAIAGGSLRYRFLDKDNSEITISQGAFYEFERWRDPYQTEEFVNVDFIKSTTNIVFRHKFSKQLNLNGLLYYQVGYDPNIEAFRNRYSVNIHLNSKLTRRLSLINFFDFSYEDRPIVPITKFIFSYRIGLGIDF